MKYAAVLDFETTSVDPNQGKVIEGAISLVELLDDRRLGNIVESYASFNDPGTSIPAEIVKLTGITDEMVKGHQLDWAKFNALCAKASVLISHNVQFDRGWLEKHGSYKTPWWACSLRMIDWSTVHGMPCRTLKHLAWEHDHFPNAHRAIDDVATLLQLLKTPCKSDSSRTYAQEMLSNAAIRKRIVFATGAPFETKDFLKEQAFRWAGEKRVWWKLVNEPELDSLLQLLSEKVYAGNPRYTVSDPVDSLDPEFKAKYGLN